MSDGLLIADTPTSPVTGMPNAASRRATPPTLAEIAAMPFPASRDALNRFFGPPLVTVGEGRHHFRIRVDFTYLETGSEEVTVEADTAEQAISLADDAIADRYDLNALLDAQILECTPLDDEGLTH